jgi:aldehyde dehydrogenase (NAD+)
VLKPESRNLIDGRLVEATGGATFPNVNPATEEVIGVTADATTADMDRAIAAARRAFDETDWATDHAFRARCLTQFRVAMDAAKDELRAIVVAEAGAPVLLAYAAMCDAAIEWMRYWEELAATYPFETTMPDMELMGMRSRRLVRREAAGVVGAITPFNFPLSLNLAKLGPALAAGCTVVLKPAPDTPWSATALGRLLVEHTDIPPGVVNVVAGTAPALGAMLASDPRVDLVTFTGSTEIGRRIMAAAAPTVKRVFLELGGKSAAIVLDDADFAKVVPGINVMLSHAGQGCVLTTRLLLPRARYEEGVALAKASFEKLAYGDPADPKHLMGPLVSKRQQERVLAHIATAVREGARLVTGGGVPAHLAQGFYVAPTIFADVDPRSTLAQEEVFGPVLAIIPFDDDAAAVRIANDSIYGLSGTVWSATEARALAVARRVRSGTLGVNGAHWYAVDTPFGGYGQSGVGRENGVAGLEEYLETKVIGLPPV